MRLTAFSKLYKICIYASFGEKNRRYTYASFGSYALLHRSKPKIWSVFISFLLRKIWLFPDFVKKKTEISLHSSIMGYYRYFLVELLPEWRELLHNRRTSVYSADISRIFKILKTFENVCKHWIEKRLVGWLVGCKKTPPLPRVVFLELNMSAET